MHLKCWTDTELVVMEYVVKGVGEQLLRVRKGVN